MKSAVEKEFIRHGRRRQRMFENEEIALRPREYNGHASYLDGAISFVFDIVDIKSNKTAGEIALRIGEGDGLFYLGHIGYHVDPPFQGRHIALQACRLCLPVFRAFGMRSLVLTTDMDNIPSIRTCEALGCVLECIVSVPQWCMMEYQISPRKRRYVLKLGSLSIE